MLIPTNKIDLRPRFRIYQSVDASLYEFAKNASADELNAAILSGLRLWMSQAEMRAMGKPLPMLVHPVDLAPAPVSEKADVPSSKEDLGFVSLDLNDLGLQGAVVHRTEGG